MSQKATVKPVSGVKPSSHWFSSGPLKYAPPVNERTLPRVSSDTTAGDPEVAIRAPWPTSSFFGSEESSKVQQMSGAKLGATRYARSSTTSNDVDAGSERVAARSFWNTSVPPPAMTGSAFVVWAVVDVSSPALPMFRVLPFSSTVPPRFCASSAATVSPSLRPPTTGSRATSPPFSFRAYFVSALVGAISTLPALTKSVRAVLGLLLRSNTSVPSPCLVKLALVHRLALAFHTSVTSDGTSTVEPDEKSRMPPACIEAISTVAAAPPTFSNVSLLM